MGLLVSVSADVDEHLVPSAEEKQVHYVIFFLDSSLICTVYKSPYCMFFSPSIEAPAFASTALPVAAVPRILLRLDMEVVDMVYQVLQGVKEQVALEEGKHSEFQINCDDKAVLIQPWFSASAGFLYFLGPYLPPAAGQLFIC